MPLAPIKYGRRGSRNVGQTQVNASYIFAAPVMGLDKSYPLVEQDPRTASLLENFIVRRQGSETRPGNKRWTTNLGGIGTEAGVATLMGYRPPTGPAASATAKLFASCDDGKIYDVTSQTSEATVPTAALTIASQNEPGMHSFVNFAAGGTNYLCIVSAGGAYYTYDDVGGWVDRTASVTGVTASTFDFIMVWKNRLWFIVENSSLAWYLPVGAITGAATSFDFGPLLVHGGELRCMASWTLDAGDGIDDKLVIVGSEGDVLVYGGTDPSTATTFGLIGRWYIGKPPSNRRFVSSYGGDISIITEAGIEYMSALLQSQGLLNPQAAGIEAVPTNRYNEVIGDDVKATRGSNGWQAIHVPNEKAVIIITPYNSAAANKQYCLSTIPKAWSTFKGMLMKCAEVFNGELYFGTDNGTVHKAFDGDTDDVLVDGTAGADVVGSLQTAYVSPPQHAANLKVPQLIMPMFQASGNPQIRAKINTEWSSDAPSGSIAFSSITESIWDTDVWDTAVWAGALNTFLVWIGVSGLGVYLALRLEVRGQPRTLFTSWKLVYTYGGIK